MSTSLLYTDFTLLSMIINLLYLKCQRRIHTNLPCNILAMSDRCFSFTQWIQKNCFFLCWQDHLNIELKINKYTVRVALQFFSNTMQTAYSLCTHTHTHTVCLNIQKYKTQYHKVKKKITTSIQ